MFFTITRLGLAALAPVIVFGQELTTYSITISGTLHTIVLPSPKVFATKTIHVTDAAFTVTSMIAESIETRTYTVTGPAAELSAAPSLPSAVGYVSAVSGVSVPFAPVVINGFSTSIQIPLTVSAPTTPVTVAPVKIAVPTTSAAISEVSVSAAEISAAAKSAAEKSAAEQESIVASNVAGSATSEATIITSAVSSDASGTLIPVVPLTKTPASTISIAASSEVSKAVSKESSETSAAQKTASSIISGASSEASSVASKISSKISSVASEASTAATGAIITSKSTETILTETSSLSVTTTESVPAPTASTSNTMIGGSGSTPSSTTLTSEPAPSSSAPPPPPQSSSTSAPTSGVLGSRSLLETGTIFIAGLITAALLI